MIRLYMYDMNRDLERRSIDIIVKLHFVRHTVFNLKLESGSDFALSIGVST